MGKAAMIVLMAFVCLAGGLTACGTNCDDACAKIMQCNIWIGAGSTCVNVCQDYTDCMTECSTSSSCAEYTVCIYQNCATIIF